MNEYTRVTFMNMDKFYKYNVVHKEGQQDKAIYINFKNMQNDTSFWDTYRRNKTTKKCMRRIDTKFKAVVTFRGRRMQFEQATQWSPFLKI